MNTTVTATGMKVQAKADGNLVINNGAPVAVGSTQTTANFNDSSAQQLTPVTYNSGWKIVDDATSVDQTTGSPNANIKAVTIVANTHYIDRLVYIASNGEALTNQTLTASVSVTDTTTVTANNAITVAFYYNVTTASGSETPSVVVHAGVSAQNISTTASFPSVMTTADGTPVLMRIFFDGAYTGTETSAYINSANVPTTGAVVFILIVLSKPNANEPVF